MSHKSAPPTVSTIGIDLGKNSFHLIGLDQRGAIIWQLKCSRAQLERRLVNIPCCLIGMEACSGAHYIARQLAALGHDVRLIPAQYVKPFLKGHKNDYRDAEAIAEAVQRPTMHFVAIKTPEQIGLGSSSYRGGSIATCWRSRSPTSLPASSGRFSRAVAPISRGSPPTSRDKGSFLRSN
jgi:hypothetical protein